MGAAFLYFRIFTVEMASLSMLGEFGIDYVVASTARARSVTTVRIISAFSFGFAPAAACRALPMGC